jgi:hypothetical protein
VTNLRTPNLPRPYSHRAAKDAVKMALAAGIKALGITDDAIARVCDVSCSLVRAWCALDRDAMLPHHAYVRIRSALPALAAYLDAATEAEEGSPAPGASSAMAVCSRLTSQACGGIAARTRALEDGEIDLSEAHDLLVQDAREEALKVPYRRMLRAIVDASQPERGRA